MTDEKAAPGPKRRLGARGLLCLFFGALFLLSAGMVCHELLTARQEARAFARLTAQVAASPGTDAAGEFNKYAALHEVNGDLFGWLAIDGTTVDYPVMYTPDEPERYLRRAFDGSYSRSGVPFLDAACFKGCNNYLVYGHDMKNGAMFAPLLDYADADFWREHQYIRFDTLTESAQYQVIAAFYAEVYHAADEGVFRYYNYTDLSDEAAFNEYLEQVYAAAVYDTGVKAEWGDQLLTLSTCSYHTEDGRFAVVARKLTGDEAA